MSMEIPNALAERYASVEVKSIWSATGKVILEGNSDCRHACSKELGLDIDLKAIESSEKVKTDVDLEGIESMSNF